ncbi:MAG: nucleotidyltransferase [Pseudomonadota bacterium]
MFLNKDFRDLLETFNAHSVRYLIVGGYAVGFHAQPRATNDLDLWIGTNPENAEAVYRALAVFGAPLHQVTAQDFEAEGYWYSFGNPPFRIDLLMSVSGLAFEDAWRNRLDVRLGELTVPLISMDDLIVNKSSAGRTRDLADLEDLQRARAANPEQS